jgi:integrase
MPRMPKSNASHFASWNARKKLAVQRNPYWMNLDGGLSLGYRRSSEAAGTWRARAPLGTGGYRWSSLGTAQDGIEGVGITFEEAKAAAREWHRQHGKQEPGKEDHSGKTVADCIEPYIEHLCRERKLIPDSDEAKAKLANTRAAVKAHIQQALGSTRLIDLRHAALVRWRNKLAATPARSRSKTGAEPSFRAVKAADTDAVRRRQATVNRVLTILKAMLNYAHAESGWIDSKEEWAGVKPFRNVDVPKIRYLTTDEVTKLLPACAPDFRKLVQAALTTGMRYGELTRLKAEDVNLEDASVYVSKSKNGEARWVYLNAEGIELFASLTAGRRKAELLFSKANGQPWLKSEQQRPMNAACIAAGIDGMTMHIARHTYASHALMGGMPLEVLQRQLGHKDLRITMRHYASLSDDYKRDAVRRTGPVFGFSGAAAALPGLSLVQKATKSA